MPLLAFTLLLLDCAEHTGRVEWVRSSFVADSISPVLFLVFSCFGHHHDAVPAPVVFMPLNRVPSVSLVIFKRFNTYCNRIGECTQMAPDLKA